MQLLGTSGSLWELVEALGTFGSFWEPSGHTLGQFYFALLAFWKPLEYSGSLWQLLGASGSSGNLWELLGASGSFC